MHQKTFSFPLKKKLFHYFQKEFGNAISGESRKVCLMFLLLFALFRPTNQASEWIITLTLWSLTTTTILGTVVKVNLNRLVKVFFSTKIFKKLIADNTNIASGTIVIRYLRHEFKSSAKIGLTFSQISSTDDDLTSFNNF